MALPACFELADEVFPRVRAETARRLVASGWSQTQTAQALRVSQAMVSKYAASPAETDALATRLSEDLVRRLTDPAGSAAAPSWCAVLEPVTDSPARAAVDDLLAAERLLRTNVPTGLLPQVGLNLARARGDALEPSQVLAYPGRLVEVAGRLLAPAPPAWGGSNHLAGLLLHARRRHPSTQALANVRGGPEATRAAQRAGLPMVRLPKGSDVEAAFRRAVDAMKTTPCLLHDEGRIGYEPCLYVAGPDASTVAQTILRLHEHLVKT